MLRTPNTRIATTIALTLALTGCGSSSHKADSTTDSGTAFGPDNADFKVGAEVDVNGDGQADGVAVDGDNDGVADGVDTDGDGKADAALPARASTGGGNTGGNGGSFCEEFAVRAEPTIPDMMIVLDRSGSMKRDNVNRWDPSVAAMKSVTSVLDQRINFGLIMFPRDCKNDLQCSLAGLGACGAGQVSVPMGPDTGDLIATELDATKPNGGTPTGETLQVAIEAFKARALTPDRKVAPQFVLLVTDGQPTCPNGNGRAMPPLQSDIDLTNTALDTLLAANVKTYVIGYDTKSDPAFASRMDEFAMHGGTGTHRAVENEQTLLDELEKIAGEAIPCSYELEMAPSDPTYVLIKLDGQQLNLNDPNGWTINDKTVTLSGTACSSLKDGKEHSVSVQVLCEQVRPE